MKWNFWFFASVDKEALASRQESLLQQWTCHHFHSFSLLDSSSSTNVVAHESDVEFFHILVVFQSIVRSFVKCVSTSHNTLALALTCIPNAIHASPVRRTPCNLQRRTTKYRRNSAVHNARNWISAVLHVWFRCKLLVIAAHNTNGGALYVLSGHVHRFSLNSGKQYLNNKLTICWMPMIRYRNSRTFVDCDALRALNLLISLWVVCQSLIAFPSCWTTSLITKLDNLKTTFRKRWKKKMKMKRFS